jgi:hypothetical protein
MEEEQSVLRWGGLAGILGGITFILVFVVVIAFVGADPAQPERGHEVPRHKSGAHGRG